MNLEFQVFNQRYEFNLRKLSDETLHSKVKWLVQEERNLLSPILHLLREVEIRKLFSSMHYKSLFEYAVKECGYSEDQAARRISAMRLLKELPEIEEKISSGELSLTNLTQAQGLFRAEKKSDNAYSKEEKLEILKNLENKSKREGEKLVLSLSSNPESLKPEKIRAVSENLNEIKTNVPDQTLKKIEKLKGLLAHSSPNISMAELLDKLCDLGLETWDKGKKQVRDRKLAEDKEKRLPFEKTVNVDIDKIKEGKSHVAPIQKTQVSPALARVTLQQKSDRVHIANSIQREVWQRANSQCEICKSTYALQIDHIILVSMGGTNEADNLRLLCRNCNQRHAIKKLGINKMQQHL